MGHRGGPEALGKQIIYRFTNERASILPTAAKHNKHIQPGDLIFIEPHTSLFLTGNCRLWV